MLLKDDLAYDLARRTIDNLLELQNTAIAVEQLSEIYSTSIYEIDTYIDILINLQLEKDLHIGSIETLINAARDVLLYQENQEAQNGV
jgi:hypothetical protein